ncbi:hypothetical protein [Methylomarinovum caldicuralii]|nr:hypothetical protein [Methylomarinovum caldicuralii]
MSLAEEDSRLLLERVERLVEEKVAQARREWEMDLRVRIEVAPCEPCC